MDDHCVRVADIEAAQGVEFSAGIEALGECVKVQACRERSGGERPVVRAEAEKLNGRVKGGLPGPAGAGEGLGCGRRAGGKAYEESRVRIAVFQHSSGGTGRGGQPPGDLFDGLGRPGGIEYSELSFSGYSGAVKRSKLGRVGFGQDVSVRSRRDEFLGCAPKLGPAESTAADGNCRVGRRRPADLWILFRNGNGSRPVDLLGFLPGQVTAGGGVNASSGPIGERDGGAEDQAGEGHAEG